MKNFYFTFGTDHITKDGIPLHCKYIKVTDISYFDARVKFMCEFTSVRMSNPAAFAFEYEEEEFLPQISKYNLTEFKHIL